MNRILYLSLLILMIFAHQAEAKRNILSESIRKKYQCCLFPQFTCTDDTFCQLYINQNMCTLLQEIPTELQNLPYVIYPTCPNYNLYRFIYNKRFNIFPHAIIRPCTISQLLFALKILRQYNLGFSIRSGGHCFEPGSLSTDYVIDLENFNEIKLDIANQQVSVGAGTRLGCLIQTLGNFGFAIPTGTCGTNGIGGLALEGGLGFLSRKFGTTSDVIKNITIVTADLNVITVDENNFSDLFFALRGAGAGSYGIVLGYTFNMFYLPTISYLQLSWNWDNTLVPQIVNAFQSWLPSLSNDITGQIDFDYTNGQRKITMTAFKANNEPFTEWIPAFSSLDPQVNLQVLPYVDAAKIEGGDSALPYLKSKSKMLFSPLPAPAIDLIVGYFQDLVNNNKEFTIALQLGSAGGALTQGNTAYFPRAAFEWFFMHQRWNNETQEVDAIASITGFYDAIEPFTSPFSYANIVDFDLVNFLNAYYGSNVPTLIQIKDKYDPTNFFNWQQSIPTS